MKPRIAIVVQRYAPNTAGSEHSARNFAAMLSEDYSVDVLTTTALDMVTWKNHFEPGEAMEGPVRVLRFSVTIGRDPSWERLYGLMLRRLETGQRTGFSIALEEEWIRLQGPHSEDLLAYLSREQGNYERVIFFTYLYSPSYFGSFLVDRARTVFVPTLHDEPAAQMFCFAHAAKRAGRWIWHSEAERSLAGKLWNVSGGRVVGLPISVPDRITPAASTRPYVLYSGRIEPGKGCDVLFDYAKNLSGVELRLTGSRYMTVPRSFQYEGYVPEQRKFELMAGSLCFVMPSPNESFSIATLEAMACGVPVLVNGANPVLVEHVEKSGGGLLYRSEAEFQSAVADLLKKSDLRNELGMRARDYVRNRFSKERVRSDLLAALRES